MKKRRILSILLVIIVIFTSNVQTSLISVKADEISSKSKSGSGTCGDNLTWILEDGILTISGDGKMDDWDSSKGMAPWYIYRNGIKKVIIGDGVTNIGNNAFFCCCELASIEIPDSVTSIGDYAFTKCSGLTKIEIPASVTYIGRDVIDGDGLIRIIVDEKNTKYDSRDNCNAIIETESNKLIVGCNKTIIPFSVISIGNSAFFGCRGLKSIKIPNGVTSIGDWAFSECRGLTKIEIPNSVTSIGFGAFDHCVNLRKIEIPNSVTTIGKIAFWGCIGLTKIEIPNSVTSIGDDAFYNCPKLTIYGNAGSYAQTFANKNGIKFVERAQTDVSESYETLATEVEKYLSDILEDQSFANGTIKGPSWDFSIRGSKYTFTPLNFDFAAGMPLSNLKYQAVIDTDSKTVKVLLGFSKNGKSEIKQTTNMNSTSWGKQYQSIKKMYKDLTGYDAKTTRATWNNFEKMKSDLNNLKCDMFISADMKITGYLEFSYAEDDLKFKEGGVIEKVSVGTTLSAPVIGNFVYVSLGLEVSEEGTIKVKMNENTPELIMSLVLATKASAKITGQIPVIAKVEGIIDATLSAKFANKDPKFTVDMKGNITIKATALAGLIEVYENTWNYLDCQVYPEFVNKKENTVSVFNTTDEMLCKASDTERIADIQKLETNGINFTEENCYAENSARIIALNNNRKLLLWLDDNTEKSDNNRTSLMYSLYDGESWSEPKEVYEDGCFNGEFSYYVGSDQKVYIVYQKGNYIFGDDTEYTEVIRNIDPYITVFDGETFTTPKKIRSVNNAYEDNFELKYSDGKLKVYYEEYTSDYLSGNSKIMSIIESIDNNSEWEESTVCQEENFISDYKYVGQQLYIQLYNENDGHYEMYKENDGTKELLKSLTQEACMEADDEYLYYIDNNILNVIKGDDAAEYTLPYGTDYKVITNGEKSKVVYEIINDDFSTEIYSGDITDGTLEEVELFASEEKYIKTYEGCVDENGEMYLATTLCTVNPDYTYKNYTLNVIEQKGKASLKTTYLYYDENEVASDKDLDLYYDVNNDGNVSVDGYSVVLYDENGNILINEKNESVIGAGESKEQKLIYHLPEDFSEKTVYIQLKSLDEKDTYSEADTIIKHNDIEITEVDTIKKCNGNYIIKCTLKNAGFKAAEDISLTLKNHGNEISKVYNTDTLNVGETLTETMVLTKEEYNELTNHELYVEATGDLPESNYENNTHLVDVSDNVLEEEHKYIVDNESGKHICEVCGKIIEYKVSLTSAVDGAASSETVALLTGGGLYEEGAEVTVTAPEKEGFTFKGWYEEGYTEDTEPKSKELKYIFRIENNINLVAVYSANASVLLNVNGESNAYAVNGIQQVSNSYSRNHRAGSVITVSYTGNNSFCYWKNDSGKIVSRNQSYTFTQVSATTLTAVTVGNGSGTEDTGYSALVEFVSYYGQIMQATTWSSKDNAGEMTLPSGPSKLGGKFKYWSQDGTTEATAETIIASIDGSKGRITLSPVYDENTETYKVTIKYPAEFNKEDTIYDNQKLGDTLTVKADAIEGKKFAYWSDNEEGTTKLSYNESYFIRISDNITLYAIYTDADTDTEAEPTISVSRVYKSEEGTKNKVSFEVTRSVPETYEVIETGVLGIIDGTYDEKTSDMTVDSSTVKKAVSTGTNNNGVYTMNINVTGKLDTTLAVRGYMIIKNKATGNISVIYTEVKTATYNTIE